MPPTRQLKKWRCFTERHGWLLHIPTQKGKLGGWWWMSPKPIPQTWSRPKTDHFFHCIPVSSHQRSTLKTPKGHRSIPTTLMWFDAFTSAELLANYSRLYLGIMEAGVSSVISHHPKSVVSHQTCCWWVLMLQFGWWGAQVWVSLCQPHFPKKVCLRKYQETLCWNRKKMANTIGFLNESKQNHQDQPQLRITG